MQRVLALVVLGVLWATSAPVWAQDANLKAALYDIKRAEGQIGALTPSRKANIVRMQRTLGMTEQRLQASPDKSSPAWQDANARLEKLKATLAGLTSGGAPAAAAPAPQKAAPAQQAAPAAPATPAPAAKAPVNQDIARATREMSMLDRNMRGKSSISQRDASRFLSELYRIGKGLAAADRAHPSWQPAAANYQKMKTEIIDIHVRILDSRHKKVAARIGKLQPTQYMVAAQVDPIRKSLAGMYGDAKGLNDPKHAALQNVIAQIEKTGDAFEARVKTASAERGKYGDIDAKLAEIKKRTYELKVPELNSYPQTQEQITAYVNGLAAVREHIATDGAYLASIDGKVPMTVEQGNSFRRSKSLIQVSKPQGIERSTTIATQTMDRWATDQNRLLEFFEKIDENDGNDQSNKLLSEGKYDEGLKRLGDVKAAIENVAFYDKVMKRADAPDRSAQLNRAEKALDDFKAKYQTALNTIRMPEDRASDKKLHDIVADVFAKSKEQYKAARITINSDLKSYEKETGNISRSSITTSTVTVYKYKWDQFQATTAEKVGDVYYLFYNTFKYYHAADPKTPTKRWFLSQRFQSSQILEKNIDK